MQIKLNSDDLLQALKSYASGLGLDTSNMEVKFQRSAQGVTTAVLTIGTQNVETASPSSEPDTSVGEDIDERSKDSSLFGD